jgi:hypothetical protein
MGKRFVTIAIFSTMFLWSYVFFKQPFELYFAYVIMAILFPFFLMRFGISRMALLAFLPLILAGVIYSEVGDNTYALFFKVFIGFFASVLFYDFVFKQYNFNVRELFGYYMKAALIVGIIGIVQLVSFRIGFEPGYNYSFLFNKWGLSYGGFGIRINSVFSEPSYFAAVLAPAFFVAVSNLFRKTKPLYYKRWQSIAMVVAYLISFSSLGIIAVFLTVLLLLLNFGLFRYAFIFVPAFYFGFNWAYSNIPEFRERFDGTFDIFSAGGADTDVHGSSFVLYNNYQIAVKNWKQNPVLGTGLGSHPIAFDRYSLTNQPGIVVIDFNKADANSMFLRLLSETGLYGTSFMIIFVFWNYLGRRRSVDDDLWVLSNATLLIILLYLFRQGHYFLNGFPFFIWMYYYVRTENRRLKQEAAAAIE